MALPKSICMVISPRDLRANRVVQMAQYLMRRGVVVEVHACTTLGQLPADYHNFKDALPHTLHVLDGIYNIPLLGAALFFLLGAFLRVRPHIKRSDMVMVCHYTFLPIACWSKLLMAKTTWYDVRDMMAYYVSPNFPQFLGPLLGVWERLWLWGVDRVTTTDSHRGFWVQRYISQGKPSQVIYNVPSIQGIDPVAMREQVAARDLSGPLDLVIAGGITADQGIGEILKAVELFGRPCRLHLIGMIHPALREQIEQAITSGQVPCEVVFEPWLSYVELVSKISRFHLGIMSKNPRAGQYGMLARGNARKIFTYMQAGLPVMAPRYKSVAIHVEEEGYGVRVDTSDTNDIAKGLHAIFDDHQEYRQMAYRGIEAIARQYNWENECDKLERFLNS